MAKPTGETTKPAPPPPKGDAGREKRLAEALRANLRRRKAAARVSGQRTRED
jgi:hypothetical protein